MKYDLLPCPFCGSRLTELVGDYVPYVHCRNCRTDGPSLTATGDEREAVALWNTRRDTEPDSDD